MTECTHINRRPQRVVIKVKLFTGKTTPAGKGREIFLGKGKVAAELP